MPSIVEQLHPSGCAVAALAMYLDKEYTEVYHVCVTKVRNDVATKGLTLVHIAQLASFFGVKLKIKKGAPRRGRAILCAKYPTTYHAVYFDGVNAFDPQWHNETTSLYLKRTIWHLTERFFS